MSELLQVRIADSDVSDIYINFIPFSSALRVYQQEQKYFKRYQMLERLSPNSGLDHLRQRASMPAG